MTTLAARPRVEWGPRVNLDGVPDLFAGTGVEPYQPPAPGIDNLGITSTDTFMVPGRREITVDFKGYVRVVRSRPSAPTWNQAEVFTNLIEMFMRGEHPEAGSVLVTLNPDYLSAGALWSRVAWPSTRCSICRGWGWCCSTRSQST
jgi:hypothetical protein